MFAIEANAVPIQTPIEPMKYDKTKEMPKPSVPVTIIQSALYLTSFLAITVVFAICCVAEIKVGNKIITVHM